MCLHRNSPFRIVFYVFHNNRIHFVSFAPFYLKKQHTILSDFGCLLFGKQQIVVVINDDFQFICFLISFFNRKFKFFRRKTHPIPNTRKWISSRSLDMHSKTFFFESTSKHIHIPRKRFSTSDNHYFGCSCFYVSYHFFNRSCRMVGCFPTFFYITPMTTYITTSDSDKISGYSRISTFTLNGVEMLH